MTMKKLFCLILALAMMSMAALAEGDLEAQLEAANARIAELEAEVEQYKPFYDAQVVVEYDGGIIALDDVLAQYDEYASMYTSYGIDPVTYGLDGTLKQQAADTLLEEAVLKAKALELGLDQLDEEAEASIDAEVDETYQGYVDSVASQMLEAGYDEETVEQQAIDYLTTYGYTKESIRENVVESRLSDALYDYTVADVELSEEDLEAAYSALVEEQKESFATDTAYNNARSNGDVIVYNPAGYRAVKHVLIQFDDDQTARKTELEDTIADLEAELDALNTVEEEVEEEEAEEVAEEETEEETEEEAVEEEDVEVEAIEEEEPEEAAEVVARSEEEINADIDAAQAEIDAIYDELMVTANEIIARFEAGEDFQTLIDEYNTDPGMQNEPTATDGYAVSADSTTWDLGFRDGAMSIENVGEISEPVKSSYGIHIIYYMADIPEGEVALDDVREALSESTLADKVSQTYNDAVDQWIADVNPVYHYDRIG